MIELKLKNDNFKYQFELEILLDIGNPISFIKKQIIPKHLIINYNDVFKWKNKREYLKN